MVKQTATKKHASFLNQPAGYLVSAVVLLAAGYLLFSLAVDSGSLAQWAGVLLALIVGTIRLIQGLVLLVKNHGKRR